MVIQSFDQINLQFELYYYALTTPGKQRQERINKEHQRSDESEE